MAVVEKLAGKISIKIKATGNHNCTKLSLKIIFIFILAKYLAHIPLILNLLR